ncbi:Uu.00g115970.m01.CDS01 [Anthostomella pinea]|uniref:Uu.00g115970.m01.CDS01 n=1 Tax=Anthostomella pinea TaxID=933095 RepID=A0AAI8VFZ4_9PEZI|nr:Uu.00g115970.m01.CDS01 [Anthostomella pinea]
MSAETGNPSAELPQLPEGNSNVHKLPPVPKGATVRRRSVPARTASTRSTNRIYVTPKTPFRSVSSRVRKQLDKYLQQASNDVRSSANYLARKKDASLKERVHRIQAVSRRGNGGGGLTDLEDAGEVLVCGTGRAIQKVVEVALFFQKQPDCIVQLRTGSVGAVDDVVVEGEEQWGAEGEQRARMMSSLEVSIKLR